MEQKIKNYTLSLMVLSLTACGGVSLGLSEPKPQIDTPSKYSEKGLEFEYPANWNKSDVLDLSGIRQVTIESPGSALVVISVYPDSLASDTPNPERNCLRPNVGLLLIASLIKKLYPLTHVMSMIPESATTN